MHRFNECNPGYYGLLSYLDSCSCHQKIFVFSTNLENYEISPAAFRPGRISQVLTIDNPTLQEKIEFLSNFENGVELAEKSGNVSFAEITYLKVCMIDSDFNVDKAIQLFKDRQFKKNDEGLKVKGFLC